jgi:predicted metal-dependent hydrolase
LNRRYFAVRLRRSQLGWSARAWRTQLGCFEPGLDQIVINSRLDRASVPAFVVEYVLFHEMLHVKHPMRVASCGLQAHSAKFRREEKRFAQYACARRFLKRLA